MKKLIAAVLSISMLLAVLAVPAMAEETDAQSGATAAVTAGGGSRGGQQPGGRGFTGGQNAPSRGQAPGRGGKNAVPQEQVPGNGNPNGQNSGQSDGQNADENSGLAGSQQQTPFPYQKDQRFMKPGRNHRGGSRAGSIGQRNLPADQAPLDLSGLVSKGIIDEETLAKIEEYLKENAPAQPAAPDMTQPEKPAENQAADSAEPPALPDGQAPVADPLSELLSGFVEKGILTQEQADAISAAVTPAEAGSTAAAPAETAGEETGV